MTPKKVKIMLENQESDTMGKQEHPSL